MAALSSSVCVEAAFEFEDTLYISGVISIKYPQIINLSDNELQDKLNKIISDSALEDLCDIQNDSTLDKYTIVSEITYSSPRLISICFKGYSSYKQSAHPNQFLHTVTIDVQNMKAIALTDLVTANKKFVSAMIGGHFSSMMGYDMTSDIISSIKDYMNELGTDYWVSELENADSDGHGTVSYLTEDALVISISVPHVMGDHIEILFSYMDLMDFRTDSPLWDILV